MKHRVWLFVTLLWAAAWGQAAEFQVQRVIGTEFPGQYKHPASVTELANGDLYLAYYSGSGEYGDDTAVYGMRLAVGQDTWTEPVVIADTPDISEGNPVVWQAPDGLVWLFYVNRYGETWSHSRVKFKISRDGAQNWSDSSILTWELGTMVRGQPIVLLDGDYLLPLYWEAGEDREQSAPETTSFFMRYNPREKTWKSTNRIHSPEGNLQAQVAQINENYLVAYLRRGGNYEPTDTGFLLRAESRDGGWTWSDAVPTSFPNPNSAVDFIRLKNGHLLLVYNNNMNDRTPLSVALSTDNDQTYPYRMDLLTGENTFAYPYAIQTRDEKIHIVYTTNERTQIMHLTLDEQLLFRHRVE
ncbi:MAG: sialidase family protein [bacterium]|jgi:predicted neuraminidase|nr:sialidase family protein [bacterium]